MDDTLEVLNCLEQFPVEYGQEQQTAEFLAGMISSSDDLYRAKSELEAHVHRLQCTAKELNIQMQQDRELRMRMEREFEMQKQCCDDWESRALNAESLLKQAEAKAERDAQLEIQKVHELLRDVSKAYLTQYEYLRHRRAFKNNVRLAWPILNNRIRATESLQDLYESHEARMKKSPFPELRDVATTCNLRVDQKSIAVCTEEVTVSQRISPVVSREIGTNTERGSLVSASTIDVGVNTTAANRVTRATQATEKKSKTVDRSSLCLILDSTSVTQEESVDLEEIFKNTICKLPTVLDGIAELVVPTVSSACQTDGETESTETMTELFNVSRSINYSANKEGQKNPQLSEEADSVKSELNSGDNGLFSLNRRLALQQFEQYWSLAGQSLVTAMHSRSLVNNTSVLDFMLQQDMVGKFLTGASGTVKKAVSIPSVYAESTKSGFEKDVDEDDYMTSPCPRETVSTADRQGESVGTHFLASSTKSFDHYPMDTSDRISSSELNQGEGEIYLQPSRTCPKRKRPLNTTVEGIRRERWRAYKIRPIGIKRRKFSPKAPCEQLKKIRLINPQPATNDEENITRSTSCEATNDEEEPTRSTSSELEMEEHSEKIVHSTKDTKKQKLLAALFLSDSDDEGSVKGMTCGHECIEQTEPSPLEAMDTIVDETDTVDPSNFNDNFQSPASPTPSEMGDADLAPSVIPTETRVLFGSATNGNCLRSLKLTHTTLNQFIQNFTPLKSTTDRIATHDTERATKILDTYLNTDWSSESVALCVQALSVFIGNDSARELSLIRIILKYVESSTDDLPFEPFNSLAPFMPKMHQMVVLIVERLHMGQRMITEIEGRLFTFRSIDTVKMDAIVNWTYLYLTLQDLEINRNPGHARPLRLFLVKALFYLKERSVAVVFMTLKAFPKLLPRIEENSLFSVGVHVDPLVDVLVCVLMNKKNELPVPGLIKFRANWKKLQWFYYGYKPFQPTPQETLKMLLDRLRSSRRDKNVVYGILLLANHMDVEWVQNHLLNYELIPQVDALMDGSKKLSLDEEQELCCLLSVIAGVVKAFPAKTDVSSYRYLFRRILLEKDRFSYSVQECAVASVLRLSAFGVEETFNTIRDWYIPQLHISLALRASVETFLNRKEMQFWVKLSNRV